jgi:hypothetical protein
MILRTPAASLQAVSLFSHSHAGEHAVAAHGAAGIGLSLAIDSS